MPTNCRTYNYNSQTQEGAEAYLDFSLANSYDIQFIALRDVYNVGDVVKIRPSTNWGNISNWDLDPVWDNGGADTLWSTALNWDTDTVPTAGDTVTFNATSNTSSIVDAGFAGTIGELILDVGFTATVMLSIALTVTNASGGNGNITINSGTLSLWGNDLTMDGTFSNDGFFDLIGTETLTGFTNDIDSGIVGYQASNSSFVAGNSYYDLWISGGTITATAALNVANDITILPTGILDLNGYDLTNTGDFSNTGILVLHGDETLTSFTNDTDSGRVWYDGPGPLYANLAAGNNYYDLTIDGNKYVLNANLDVNNNLSITSNGQLRQNGYDLDLTGATFSNEGQLDLEGSETLTNFTNDVDSGNIYYRGAGSYTGLPGGNVYYGLEFNGAGTWALNANLDVNNQLTITQGYFRLKGYDLDLTGAGACIIENTGMMYLEGTETLTNFVNDTDSGTVVYDDVGVTGLVGGDDYYNLWFWTGTYLSSAAVDVNNRLYIRAGAEFDLNGNDLDLTGATFDNSGTLKLQGGETLTNFTNDTDSGLIWYTGPGAGAAYTGFKTGNEYFDLKISSPDYLSVTLNAALQINNNLTNDGYIFLSGNGLDLTGATFNNNKNIYLRGDETLTNFSIVNGVGSVVYYTGYVGVLSGLPTGYNYAGLGIQTASTTIVLEADLTIEESLTAGGTLDLDGYDLTLNTAWHTLFGTIRLRGDETVTGANG